MTRRYFMSPAWGGTSSGSVISPPDDAFSRAKRTGRSFTFTLGKTDTYRTRPEPAEQSDIPTGIAWTYILIFQGVGGRDRTRTGTPVSQKQILSLLCLPFHHAA